MTHVPYPSYPPYPTNPVNQPVNYVYTIPTQEPFVVRGNQIACTPFKTDAIEPKISKGFGTVAQKTTLTGLVVVYGDGVSIRPGDVVFVPGDLCATPQAKQVYEIEAGKPFILLSLDHVKVVQKLYPQWSVGYDGTMPAAAPATTISNVP